ncbi:hypothetical protein CPC08DRAFT_657870 [Agrocybe pediades]|nr:hypothetical protein CPC08DRAFT_657870 [Agrocybe pediades]
MTDPQTSTAPSKESAALSDNKPERTSIVELKNGKVIFKQKPISFEKQSQTLQEIVKFRSMLEERISNKEAPLSAFPQEHFSVIAKLAHESDKTLTALAKHIRHELLPTLDDDEDNDAANAISASLPVSLVESAIQQVLVRNNYGLEVPLGVKAPAAISVWRWEVRTEHMDWLPKNSREKAELRLAERIQAKEDLKAIFEGYSQEERDAIIDPKGNNKLPPKELNKPSTTPASDSKVEEKNAPQSAKKQGKKKAEEVENDSQPADPKLRSKKPVDPEKAAKEKERQDKKAARLEKEKKEKEAHNKSQSLMAKFFTKPKPSSKPKNDPNAVAGPSKIQTEFEKVFKPFVLQKDKVLAPANWFKEEKKRSRRAQSAAPGADVIVLDDSDDDSDIEMVDPQPSEQELAVMSNKDRLRSILATLPPAAPSKLVGSSHDLKLGKKAGYKVYNPVSVRDLVSQLSEAEVSGNDDLVRTLIAKLNDRELLPAKAFCFHTDARPGYYGTWTRNSRIIGPRRPFAKDTLVFDYSYDSGEEWEEEPMGEDVVEDGEDEDVDADEPDSDLDSWLVDDDEEPSDLAALRDSSPPPLDFLPVPGPAKRKADDGERKMGKKRKVVVPLVPFAKGPILETTIGKCEYEPFKPYAIQLFNDTPYSVDPFTFVSTCVDDYKTFLRTANTNTNVPNANGDTSEGVFAVPALPPRLTGTAATIDLSSNATTTSTGPKKVPTAKSIFPEAHIQLLLDKITQLQASSITTLVESIHLELREHKVKKNAIENKVREVGEKCKDKKVWVIKPALLQQQNPVV